MAISTSTALHRALSSAEIALIEETLSQLPGWKIRVTARATVCTGELCETGALALLQGTSSDGYALILFDTTRGDELWLQALSAHSRLLSIDIKTRHYRLIDGDSDQPADITFFDDTEEFPMSKCISKYCRRLNKRTTDESRLRISTNGSLSSSPEEVSSSRSPEIPVPSRKHGVTSSPDVRKWASEGPSRQAIDKWRRSTAPAVMGELQSDDRRTRKDSTEKVEKWLERMSISAESPSDSPTISSAPPLITVQSPTDDQAEADEINERRWPSSCPHCISPTKSQSLLVPGTTPTIRSDSQLRSSSQKSGPKTWTATIGDVKHEIPDVTKDITNVHTMQEGDEGGFGCVRRATLNGLDVAIKQIKPSSANNFSPRIKMIETKRFRKEVMVAMLCNSMRHPNIIEFKGVAMSDDLGACLVFPWMENGDSLTYVVENPTVPCVPIIHGTLKGLKYLHKRHFRHGDMKAHNVLMSNDRQPQISDFGLATHKELEGEEPSTSILRAGNIRWMAHELLDDGPKIRTKMSDMWAFGMFAIEILTGNLPFPDQHSASIMSDIENHKLPKRPENPECSDILWDLIQSCWKKDPGDRITAKRALRIMNAMESHVGGGSQSPSEVEYIVIE